MQHPGTLLRTRFLEPLGINANQLALGLGVHRSTVSRLLSGAQPMTPQLAARLGAYLGVPARWFLLMQAEYDAERVADDSVLVSAVEPWDPDPNWLLTPDGALWLGAGGDAEKAPAGVRTIRLDNGAVILEGSADA